MKKFLKEYKWFLLGAIVVFAVSLLFPYTGDDWQWRTWDFSWSVIKSLFTDPNINGRYVANIIVLLLTKNIILRGIVISIVLSSIVEVISRTTKCSRLYIWVFLGLLPAETFRQSISWASGFTNYVISTLLVLINILLVEKLFHNPNKKWYVNVGIFLLFFLSSFFIENVTIFFILLNLTMSILYYVKNKKININLAISSVASIIGAVIMFLQPCYRNIASGDDFYRTLGGGIGDLIIRICTNFTTVMADFISVENIFIVLFLVILLYVWYIKEENNNRFLKYSFYYLFLYTFYIIGLRVFPTWNPLLSHTIVFNAIVSLIFLIVLLINIILLFIKTKEFPRILLITLTLIGLVAPLCIVKPIGARNFLGIYVLEIFLVLTILPMMKWKPDVRNLLALLLIVLTGYYITVYGYIQFFSEKRLEYVEYMSSNGETVIDVPILPYSDYVWVADPSDEYNSHFYKAGYGLDENIQFVFHDYTYWYNEIYLKSDKFDEK